MDLLCAPKPMLQPQYSNTSSFLITTMDIMNIEFYNHTKEITTIEINNTSSFAITSTPIMYIKF